MIYVDNHRIGQTLRLSGNESQPDYVLEGVLTDVIPHRDRLFEQVQIGEEWTYVSDWGTYDVIEKDGKRLPQEVGVYKILDELFGAEDELVQLDDKGQWWPYPYVFSGWRASELLELKGLVSLPELTTDYPAIKDPAEEAEYLRSMAEKARLWDEGYRANQAGIQAFRNPYKICSKCSGVSGEHDQKLHDLGN